MTNVIVEIKPELSRKLNSDIIPESMNINRKQRPKLKKISEFRFRISVLQTKLQRILDARPMTSFFAVLLFLVGLIILGNVLRRPPTISDTQINEPAKVNIFSIGEAPRIVFSGVVEKSGVVKIVAQTPGIVSYVNVREGSRVWGGQILLGLATNYAGASIPAASRQIAEQNYTFTEANVPAQIEMIKKRREIAERGDAQADQLRDIAAQSIQATKDQISLNEQILSSLDAQIAALESTNIGGANDALILQAKQGKAGVLSGLSALRSALRTTEYQSSNDKEPAQLSNLGKDLTLKQLEVEERSVQLSKEIARLNLRIAQINESLMYPVAPGAGTVERVYVTPGQSVSPGTVLATVNCDTNLTTIVVPVSTEIAQQVSRIERSSIQLGSERIELTPRYVSSEPTEGNLHSVLFTVPEISAALVADGSRVSVEIPVGQAKASVSVPYVPIDAVFQTQDTSLVYVASRSGEGVYTATAKTVELGAVFGSYVQIRSGISAEDQVILDRNILSGDAVTF